MPTQEDTHVYDYIIIGAGPAGLQLGYFLEKAGRDYVILEAGEGAGTFFTQYPRHRTLISNNKVNTGRSELEFNLRHDWNSLLTDPSEPLLMKEYSQEYFPPADAFVRYLRDFASRFSIRIRNRVRVRTVKRADTGNFDLLSNSGEHFMTRQLIVAAGVTRPYIPDIPGIEFATGYESMSIDPQEFKNQSILILGKGNSAFETADNLIETAAIIHLISPCPIKFAWESHYVGHLRAVNNNFVDTYLLKSQNGVVDGHVHSIERLPSGKLAVVWQSIHANEVDAEIERLEYDRVIRCTGFRFDAGIFDASCRPDTAINERFPKLTGAWESENVPGLYFAGVLTQTLDYKKSQSGFIHGFRYNVRSLYHILEERYGGRPLPFQEVAFDAKALGHAIINRVNMTSSLWQQVGFLCDMLVPDGGKVRWYHDLNHEYVLKYGAGADPKSRFYTLHLSYGPCPANIVSHDHTHPYTSDVVRGKLPTEIHPVIRRYHGTQLAREYHVRSDILSDWDSNYYRDPLIEFLEKDMMDQDVGRQEITYRVRELIRNAEMRFDDFRVRGDRPPM